MQRNTPERAAMLAERRIRQRTPPMFPAAVMSAEERKYRKLGAAQ